MKVLRLMCFFALVLSITFAATMLTAPAWAQGGGGGGRGGAPPPVIPTPTPEVMNEDPQTENLRNDRMGFPAFKIIGNVYYIGTAFASSYLITTPQGNIVINSNREETLPLMKTAIESLGFKIEDTRFLLGSHAHGDHQSADAAFKQMVPGVQTAFMEQDVPALRNMRTGGKEHPIDRVLKDGDTVSLGGATLTAHLTPGHTLGCTTWTFPVREGNRTYNVNILCGGMQDNARLVYNTNNPNVQDTWRSTIAKWKSLPCDVFLGSHSWFFNLTGKYKRMQANPNVNPWIESAGYHKYIADTEALMAKLIAEQTAAGPPPPNQGRGGGRGGAGAAGGRGN
jgi:metallo-beta-lactamase class B